MTFPEPNVPRTIEGVMEQMLECIEGFIHDGLLEPMRVTPVAASQNFSLYTKADGTYDLRGFVEGELL
jgi:hypothetical protein